MPRKATTTKTKSKNGNGVNLGIEAELWQAVDKLREHLYAVE